MAAVALTAQPCSVAPLKAHPLPPKIHGWEALHLVFRYANLPNLPTIHDKHIRSVLRNKNYEKPTGPSGHSVQTLAWCGDAVLYLASTKACLKAGLKSQRCKQLGSIRGGLTTNRTFSYLTLSYRINELLDQKAPMGQKRYADLFEAYIGAAWASASETKDPVHIHEIESFLSQLFKPKVWPALESLANGSLDLVTTVQLDQDLENEIAVLELPPIHMGQSKKAMKKSLSRRQARSKKLVEIAERHRQHVLADRMKNKAKSVKSVPTPLPVRITGYDDVSSPRRSPRRTVIRDTAERKRQSAITNRVAMRLSARSHHQSHITPLKSKSSRLNPSSRLEANTGSRAGDGVEKDGEVDMDLDSEWEDIRIVPKPRGLIRTDRYVGAGSRSGTMDLPIVVD